MDTAARRADTARTMVVVPVIFSGTEAVTRLVESWKCSWRMKMSTFTLP